MWPQLKGLKNTQLQSVLKQCLKGTRLQSTRGCRGSRGGVFRKPQRCRVGRGEKGGSSAGQNHVSETQSDGRKSEREVGSG